MRGLPRQKSTYLGLNSHHRISWNDPYNRTCIALAGKGFSIDTIARTTGLTKGQVIYRLRKKNLSVMDWRNGVSVRAIAALSQYAICRNKKQVG